MLLKHRIIDKFVEQKKNYISESIADNKTIIVSLNPLNKTENEGEGV